MNNLEIWQAVLAELELMVSKANFNTWFKNTGITTLQEGQVVVCVPSTFSQAWIEKKYHHHIIKSLERVTEKPIKKLEYKIDSIKNIAEACAAPAPNTEIPPETVTKPATTPTSGGFTLNPKYSFDNFVVGRGTELAFAAAQAVSNRPGEAYNPLFIYGGVGLGKTHLLQAIGNEIIKKNPHYQIVYVSAEKFTNDYISSMKGGEAKNFQDHYRTADALLIDDIQFIAGKDGTQESFFHTFNELHQANKQVILTSDRPPKAIPALEDRLKSRFEWGMIVDVAAPDFETRVAILGKKTIEKNFPLEEKLIKLIALSIQSNIRELEGALNKIIAYHDLKHLEPNEESIKTLLTGLSVGSMRHAVAPRQVIDAVCEFYNVNFDEITSKNREKRLSNPRQIVMFMLREELKTSFPTIGDELGGRDHTTAMHAYEKIKREVENDIKLKQEIDLIKQKLYINNV
ncbi:MAG: hypothetical protein A3J93_05090 [Candidatus Magasanikbacteria bacterium RIFOXYC2_FULL_42_28]|uniref:Chromosomal replication initiator protein DnaA n=1 Tax=Candidatus Magasanikbacteria bacterium RIFOXYC2_FULL_42_28 TaxID=1798704 RepID=A0A1F6NV09_9BACT|nr:MAG: hypothetical protein A3J93_05090 [Candidatus Magasanikbacteria bacterium RIFOXYC2_FULL_42_28]